jgi:hypothetical protein
MAAAARVAAIECDGLAAEPDPKLAAPPPLGRQAKLDLSNGQRRQGVKTRWLILRPGSTATTADTWQPERIGGARSPSLCAGAGMP